MLKHELDAARSILRLRPDGPLAASDFEALATTVDPHIETVGDLAGLVIEVPSFPGWESLGAMAAHMRFVRDHHRSIRRVAVVTDSPLGRVAEQLASHFVAAEIRHFPAGRSESATAWILGGPAEAA